MMMVVSGQMEEGGRVSEWNVFLEQADNKSSKRKQWLMYRKCEDKQASKQ